jgi:hypothetical protein
LPRRPGALFCQTARPAGIFQNSPGEFRAKNFPVLPAGLAGVTF